MNQAAWLYFEDPCWETSSSAKTYRSICRSFLFPTSIIGTLQQRGRQNFVIQVRLVPHILHWQTNRYLLDLSHHVQQFFMDHLYHFEAERNEGQVYFTAAGMPWISERIWVDLWKRTFCLMWLNRPGYNRWCLWSRSVGRWSTHPRDRHSVEDVSLQYLEAELKNNAITLTRTCPAVSTSWRWYSCPFIVIILVNAEVQKDKENEEHNQYGQLATSTVEEKNAGEENGLAFQSNRPFGVWQNQETQLGWNFRIILQ